MKFLSALAAVACAVVGVTRAQEAALPQCLPLNFTAKAGDIKQLNGVIDLAIKTGLLAKNLVKFDPLVIENKRLDNVPFSVLGHDFALTPVIEKLTASGISTVLPRQVAITSDHSLNLGADFNGTVSAKGTLRFEIAQLNRQWWQICWVNPLKPKDCPPAVVPVDVAVGLSKPGVGVNTILDMLRCPPDAPKGSCKDLTVSDILVAALQNKFDALLKRILLRFKAVSIDSLAVSFESMTDLSFHFHSSGPLITELGKKLYKFAATEVNKKGDIYNVLIDVTQKLGKKLLNDVIAEKLAPGFGAGCYDPKP